MTFEFPAYLVILSILVQTIVYGVLLLPLWIVFIIIGKKSGKRPRKDALVWKILFAITILLWIASFTLHLDRNIFWLRGGWQTIIACTFLGYALIFALAKKKGKEIAFFATYFFVAFVIVTPLFEAHQIYNEFATTAISEGKNCEMVTENMLFFSPLPAITNDNRARCFYARAFAAKDPQLCAAVSIPSLRDQCYGSLVKENDDQEFCERTTTTDGKDWCYGILASATQNQSFCEKITSPESKQRCLRNVWNIDDDKLVIQNVWSVGDDKIAMGCDNNRECIEKVAMTTENATVCDLIPPAEEDCRILIDGVDTYDPKMCLKNLEWKRSRCYSQIAAKKRQPELCLDAPRVNYCLGIMNIFNYNTPSRCDLMLENDPEGDGYTQESCLAQANSPQ